MDGAPAADTPFNGAANAGRTSGWRCIISSNTATSHLRRAWPGLAVPGLPLLAGRSRRNDWDQAMWNVLAEGWLSVCHLASS